MNTKTEAVDYLQKGKVGILQTDTIYGLVGQALNKQAVEKIYKIKKRSLNKPFIILINHISDLKLFKIELKPKEEEIIKKYWPGPTSIILSCPQSKFKYLHRGHGTLAFRLPKQRRLREIIKSTGPLVAPSANLEGEKPIANIPEAKRIFSNQVYFYYGRAKKKQAKPSKIISLKNGKLVVLRP